MIILIVLLLLGVGGLIFTLVIPARIAIENNKKTADALAQAKTALIGYAAAQGGASGAARPGELPCPNLNTNVDGTPTGSASTPCNTLSTRIGLLPWKELGLPPLRDGSGELLWYAVSNTFKTSSRTGILNSDTPGDFSITDATTSPSTSTGGVIAVVFAPGGVVSGQIRDTATVPCTTTGTSISRRLCAANYLEGENADAANNTFETRLAAVDFNDQVMPITSQALFSIVNVRVAKEAITALNTYRSGSGYYPFANAYGSTSPPYNCTSSLASGRFPIITTACGIADWPPGALPAWFSANNWNLVTHYAASKTCTRLNLGTFLGFIDLDALALSSCDSSGILDVVINLLLNILGRPPVADAPISVTGVSSNVKALVIVSGGPMTSPVQTHPCGSATNCMEDGENSDGDAVYVKPSRYPASNDQMGVSCATNSPCNVIP
jgi:type II secretory pathway pseudopilin PulG